MERLFIEAWDYGKDKIRAKFQEKGPDSYEDIVKSVVELAAGDKGYGVPDPDRIHVIDDGDYQGTQVFVIGAKGYQPSQYWYVSNYYGSCSGCDTLEHINSLNGWNEKPNEAQVDQWMMLCLHIVQRIRKMDDPN